MIGVLLLVQWLTSAYACPQGLPAASQQPVPGTTAAVILTDCHGMTVSAMDPANPALCKAHCEADQQAPVAKVQGDVPQPLLCGFLVTGPLLQDLAPSPIVTHGVARFGGPPGWPPLYLIHLVLRN
jgi:hypothetical protein